MKAWKSVRRWQITKKKNNIRESHHHASMWVERFLCIFKRRKKKLKMQYHTANWVSWTTRRSRKEQQQKKTIYINIYSVFAWETRISFPLTPTLLLPVCCYSVLLPKCYVSFILSNVHRKLQFLSQRLSCMTMNECLSRCVCVWARAMCGITFCMSVTIEMHVFFLPLLVRKPSFRMFMNIEMRWESGIVSRSCCCCTIWAPRCALSRDYIPAFSLFWSQKSYLYALLAAHTRLWHTGAGAKYIDMIMHQIALFISNCRFVWQWQTFSFLSFPFLLPFRLLWSTMQHGYDVHILGGHCLIACHSHSSDCGCAFSWDFCWHGNVTIVVIAAAAAAATQQVWDTFFSIARE